jgi:hypothetical protein
LFGRTDGSCADAFLRKGLILSERTQLTIGKGKNIIVQSLVEPDTEDLADAMGRQPPESEFTASLEDLVDGKVAFEDEVAAAFDLRDGVQSAVWRVGGIATQPTSHLRRCAS